MPISSGSAAITKAFLGIQELSAAYVGDQQIFSKPTTPVGGGNEVLFSAGNISQRFTGNNMGSRLSADGVTTIVWGSNLGGDPVSVTGSGINMRNGYEKNPTRGDAPTVDGRQWLAQNPPSGSLSFSPGDSLVLFESDNSFSYVAPTPGKRGDGGANRRGYGWAYPVVFASSDPGANAIPTAVIKSSGVSNNSFANHDLGAFLDSIDAGLPSNWDTSVLPNIPFSLLNQYILKYQGRYAMARASDGDLNNDSVNGYEAYLSRHTSAQTGSHHGRSTGPAFYAALMPIIDNRYTRAQRLQSLGWAIRQAYDIESAIIGNGDRIEPDGGHGVHPQCFILLLQKLRGQTPDLTDLAGNLEQSLTLTAQDVADLQPHDIIGKRPMCSYRRSRSNSPVFPNGGRYTVNRSGNSGDPSRLRLKGMRIRRESDGQIRTITEIRAQNGVSEAQAGAQYGQINTSDTYIDFDHAAWGGGGASNEKYTLLPDVNWSPSTNYQVGQTFWSVVGRRRFNWFMPGKEVDYLNVQVGTFIHFWAHLIGMYDATHMAANEINMKRINNNPSTYVTDPSFTGWWDDAVGYPLIQDIWNNYGNVYF